MDANQPPANSDGAGPKPQQSFKDLTIGQLGELLDQLKKFWLFFAAVGATALAAYIHFAPQTALERLECRSDKRLLLEQQKQAVQALTSQLSELQNQRANLLQIQNSLLQVEIRNSPQSIQLRPLHDRLDALIFQTAAKIASIEKEETDAKKPISILQSQVEQCGDKK